MKKYVSILFSFLLIVICGMQPLNAQDATNNYKSQFLGYFEYASRVLSLAEAMPADKYDWRPSEGVSSVEEVYTHIARYNYYYLESSLNIHAPKDINVDNIESMSGKQQVVDILERSIQHVKSSINEMPVSKLEKKTELYGRTVNGQAVLMQLITHMSEHVGQSIAYARINGVVPPWSE